MVIPRALSYTTTNQKATQFLAVKRRIIKWMTIWQICSKN
nr:MAG TPA: hypothetical protein [Caudoviricetes sp.]